jgi:AcrR family transcriptional regulator
MAELTKRQNEIVKISIKLISEGGIQNFTMKSLAKQLGVSEPAIYRHFSSKLEILLSMLRLIEKTNTDFKSEIEKSNPSLSLIENMFVQNAKVFTATPELSSIIFSEEIFQNNPTLSKKVFDIMEERNKLTLQVVDKIQNSGEIRDDVPAEKITLMILGALRITISKWKLSGFNFNLNNEVKDTWMAINTLLKK